MQNLYFENSKLQGQNFKGWKNENFKSLEFRRMLLLNKIFDTIVAVQIRVPRILSLRNLPAIEACSFSVDRKSA